MAEVKWIKITTDVFDDEKILLIESLPDANAIIVVWFKLLCLAGKQNNSGVFMLGKIAYTEEMLATIFRMNVNTVKLALQTFEQFGMVEIIDGVITIPNWGKHQSLDQLENKKEYMRNYMQKYREKQKALTQNDKLCENGLPLNEWIEVLKFFNHECAYCGSSGDLEQEHIVPVNKGGVFSIGNIVPSCRRCNASKGTKDMQAWYRESDVFNQERLEKIMSYSCKTNVRHLHKTNVSQADIDIDKELDKDIEEYILSDSESKKAKKTKHKYGEYHNVSLTDEELEKLKAEFPDDWEERIERVSSYVASTGKTYKNYLATIRNWARNETKKKPVNTGMNSADADILDDLF